MGNGFLYLDEQDWEKASDGQRARMIYKTLRALSDKQKEIEAKIADLTKRPWADRACAFAGGVFGGIGAWLVSEGWRIMRAKKVGAGSW